VKVIYELPFLLLYTDAVVYFPHVGKVFRTKVFVHYQKFNYNGTFFEFDNF